jgi:DNA-binding NtrC family response regulator
MNSLIQLAARVAIRDVPVVIQGPTGTGKEVLANAIHQASSRSQEKLVIVNCGSIPESLIESALFGHKKGAFTGAVSDKKGFFAEADGGTLFLDEVGELSLSAQVQLLRAIQQGEIQRVGDDTSTKVNVRIIAATHKNLLAMVDDGLFREDLFYRLAVGVLQVPRLSERKEDILPLSEALLKEINQDASTQPGFSPKTLSEGAKQLIYTYDWPGNVRELRTTLLRASIWSEIDLIEDQHIRQAIIWRDSKTTSDDVSYIAEGFDLNNHLAEVKKKHIEQALIQTKFRKKEAAELLGLGNHQTLSNWAKKVGLEI